MRYVFIWFVSWSLASGKTILVLSEKLKNKNTFYTKFSLNIFLLVAILVTKNNLIEGRKGHDLHYWTIKIQ